MNTIYRIKFYFNNIFCTPMMILSSLAWMGSHMYICVSLYRITQITKFHKHKIQNNMHGFVDRVWQRCLLFKLLPVNCGISGNLLRWFDSYIQSRSQKVIIEGISSFDKQLKTCVTQGSILTLKMLPNC